MTFWQALLVSAGGNIVFFFLYMAYFRWAKREERVEQTPLDLSELKAKMEAFEADGQDERKTINQLGRDVVNLRGQVKYLEGRINGTEWKRG